MPRRDRRPYALAAMLLLLASIAYEIFRLFVPWPHVTHAHSAVISTALLVLWTTTVVWLAVGDESRFPPTLAVFCALAAPFSMLLHFSMTRIQAKTYAGVPYFVGALVLAFLMKRTYLGVSFRAGRHHRRRGAPGFSGVVGHRG